MATETYSPSMLRTYSVRTADNTSTYFIPKIEPTMKILDIGCGPGSITLDLAGLVPEGEIIGIDTSTTAIDSAQEPVKTRNVKNASFRVADVLNLPFANEAFDIVCTHQVLIHLPNENSKVGAVEGLKEMRRVCKVGGLVCARECDWRSAVVDPPIPEVLASMKLVEELASKKTSPYGGKARSWAEGAGFNAGDVEASAAAVYYSSSEVKWWGETMARRLEQGSSLERGVREGFIGEDQREKLPMEWRMWAERTDALFSMTDVQIGCKKQ
jgi:ubiquinone/menaquinone biosynthesis C-methylase UbiE